MMNGNFGMNNRMNYPYQNGFIGIELYNNPNKKPRILWISPNVNVGENKINRNFYYFIGFTSFKNQN